MALRERPGSFWPSSQQVLLLRAALLDRERGEAAWRKVSRDLDIENLELGSSMLLPLIHEQLTAWDLDDVHLGKMKGVYRWIWARNQVSLDAFRQVLEALHGARVETLVFASAHLATSYYARPGSVHVGEAAVLVRPPQRSAALRALADAGWQIHEGSGRQRRVERDGGPSCAVCWRLIPELERWDDPWSGAELWRASVEIEVNGVSTRALCAADELLLACIDGARAKSVSRVQWVADAATVIQTSGGSLDWERLVSEAVERRCVLRLRDALGFLDDTVGVDVPADVLARLDAVPSTRREQLAHRISGRGGAVLGNLPATVANHIVMTQSESVSRVALGLPATLRAVWGVETVAGMPVAAVRRGRSAIVAARERRRPVH